jgi:poly-gamma-glutamate synthesis protein (capsule biosynthesis protein)
MKIKIGVFIAFSVLVLGIVVGANVSAPVVTNSEHLPLVKGEKISTDNVSLQFFGDIMLDRNVAKAMGKNGLSYIFVLATGTKQLFESTDFRIANLEGPFAVKRINTTKSIAFRFDPSLALQLKQFGFSGFDLANNHSYDMGSSNVVFTRKTLAKAGLGYFGDELKEGTSYTWVTSTTNGQMVAFLGVHNTYHNPDLKKLAVALQQASTTASLVVVNVHWGVEYQANSTKKQQTLAHWLIDRGADVVIGHHPHVVEEAEIYKGKPIFYSLGNFVFDQYFSTPTQEGLSVVLQAQNGTINKIKVIPFFSTRSQVQAMEGGRKEKFLQWLNKNSRLGTKQFIDGILTF